MATSELIADYVASLDEAMTAEEVARAETDRKRLIESVEGFRQGPELTLFEIHGLSRILANKVQKSDAERRIVDGGPRIRRATEEVLDDCLSRLMVRDIPRMVARVMQLEPLFIEQPRAPENPYLVEATRCYVFGLFSACVALSRSALEQAFSTHIPPALRVGSREDKLQVLIRTARNSILKRKAQICDLADSVRKSANSVVHGKAALERQALEALRDTRRVILFLSLKSD